MDDPIGKTRIGMRSGVNYIVLEPFEDVRALVFDAFARGLFAELTSVTGQSAFPPERLFLQASEIASVQECSLEAWVWQQRASELHYARQLEETSPQARMANAFERLSEQS